MGKLPSLCSQQWDLVIICIVNIVLNNTSNTIYSILVFTILISRQKSTIYVIFKPTKNINMSLTLISSPGEMGYYAYFFKNQIKAVADAG